MASVTGHDDDNVLSLLLRLLPPLPAHSVDVRVNLQPLIPPRKISKTGVKAEKEEEQEVPTEEGNEAKEHDLKATEKDTLELKDDMGKEELTEGIGQDEKNNNESEECE